MGRPEPSRESFRQVGTGEVSYPRDMAVGADQNGRRGLDVAEYRELPDAVVRGVDQADSLHPRSDVETASLVEVEKHGEGVVEQREDACRAVRGLHVDVGHAPP